MKKICLFYSCTKNVCYVILISLDYLPKNTGFVKINDQLSLKIQKKFHLKKALTFKVSEVACGKFLDKFCCILLNCMVFQMCWNFCTYLSGRA